MKTIQAALAVLFLGSIAAIADEDHNHESKHGGVVVESGHHVLEIVAADGSLQLHVAGEDGKPEDVKDAKATAAILSGGKKEDVVLAPAEPNFLKGTGAFKAAKGTVIIVTLSMPGHDPEQVRVKLD